METDKNHVDDNSYIFGHRLKQLNEDEKRRLESQNTLMVPEQKAKMLERDAQRHWNIFYKRNGDKFFRERHWITQEFQELNNFDADQQIVFLELGCGVGNMIFPLIKEGFSNFYFYACDFSPRAIDFLKSNKLFNEHRMKGFCADLTTNSLFDNLNESTVDIASLIFVLSAITPPKWPHVIQLVFRALRPGGLLLFRDYGRYDMSQLRFKPGQKIADNFYVRQDGRMAYYFTEEELQKLFTDAGFEVIMNTYVQHQIVNFKKGINMSRINVTGKYRKPIKSELNH